jgi:hypothetical protein
VRVEDHQGRERGNPAPLIRLHGLLVAIEQNKVSRALDQQDIGGSLLGGRAEGTSCGTDQEKGKEAQAPPALHFCVSRHFLTVESCDATPYRSMLAGSNCVLK